MVGVPILLWLAGYALNMLIETQIRGILSREVPALQSITVIGPLRWLFGRKPTKGPILLIGFWWQLTAFISLLGLAAIRVLAFDLDAIWELVALYVLPMFGAVCLTMWIWCRQFHTKSKH